MKIEIEELEAVDVAESGDYRLIWNAILDAPKDGTPRKIKDSETWSVKCLERVRAAIRGRYRRSGLPFLLHLQGGPHFSFYWTRDYDVGLDDPQTAKRIAWELQQDAEKIIAAGGFRGKKYRKRVSYEERLQKKTLRRGLREAEKATQSAGHDEEVSFVDGGPLPW